jgi:proteasome lid subunit RPN8/RPN11
MSKQIELTLTKETKGTFVYASKEEVAKVALYANAAAVILAHNHPSGQPVPSAADKRTTVRIKDALALLDISIALRKRGCCDMTPVSKLFLAVRNAVS